MGNSTSTRTSGKAGAAWFDAYASRVGQPFNGAAANLRGTLQRHGQQPRSPLVLQLSPSVTVLAGMGGIRSTSETANQVIKHTRATRLVLMTPPDAAIAQKAVSEGSAADFERWLAPGQPSASLRAFTAAGSAESMADVHLSSEACASILSGPLGQSQVPCRRTGGRVVMWDESSGLANEALSAVRTLYHTNGNGSVYFSDVPMWMQLLHVASSHNHAQVSRLVHAVHTAQCAQADSNLPPGPAAMAALLAPSLRMPPIMTSPELEAISSLTPLLAAARHRCVATAIRSCELQGMGHTVALVPPAHLHGVRFAYTQLADAQQSALAADDALVSLGGVRHLRAQVEQLLTQQHVLQLPEVEHGVQLTDGTEPAAPADSLLHIPSSDHVRQLASGGESCDVAPSRRPAAAAATGGIAAWFSKATSVQAHVQRSPAGTAAVRPPAGVEGAPLQVLPDPLCEAALLATPVPGVYSSILPGHVGELAAGGTGAPVAWLGALLESLLGVSGATRDAHACRDSLVKLAWLNAVMHKPAPWGGLVHGHAVDAMSWGVGRAKQPVALRDQAAGRAARGAMQTGATLQDVSREYRAAHDDMQQWLAASAPLDVSNEQGGGVQLDGSAEAIVTRGGFLPLRQALVAYMQAQQADEDTAGGGAQVGAHLAAKGRRRTGRGSRSCA